MPVPPELSEVGVIVPVIDSWRAWARVGHLLGERAGRLLDQSLEHLVLGAEKEHYVQWHGEPGRALYAEASSGLYDGVALLPVQSARLCDLGWDLPVEGVGGSAALNWSRWWDAPVPVYDVVLLTVRTLAEVFSARPDEVVQELSRSE